MKDEIITVFGCKVCGEIQCCWDFNSGSSLFCSSHNCDERCKKPNTIVLREKGEISCISCQLKKAFQSKKSRRSQYEAYH